MMTDAKTTGLVTLTAAPPTAATVTDDAVATPTPQTTAPFVLRIGALLIDYMIMAGLLALMTMPGRVVHGSLRSGGSFVDTFGWWIALGVGVFNFLLLPLWRGQTLGKWATGLEIARFDGAPLRIVNPLLRHFVGYPLTLATGGLGFLLTIFNADNRALHDFIAGTIVTRARKRLPSERLARRTARKSAVKAAP